MKLDDERVKFYLNHVEQLEEWLGLRKEVATAVDEWFGSLRVPVGALADSLSNTVRAVEMIDLTSDQADYPGLYLKAKDWPVTNSQPSILVGIQWAAGKTLPQLATSAPWVGIRCDKNTAIGAALRADAGFQVARKARKETALGSWWPTQGYVFPKTSFLEAREEYARELVKAIESSWHAYVDAIDRAVSSSAL